jgi:hypothetical protein
VKAGLVEIGVIIVVYVMMLWEISPSFYLAVYKEHLVPHKQQHRKITGMDYHANAGLFWLQTSMKRRKTSGSGSQICL